jgi:hypothetical protein
MRRLATALLAAALALAAPAQAELVVVAHPKAGVEQLTRSQVINIFLGRFRQLPTGAVAQPVDLPEEASERATFYRQLVGKEPAEIASYWSRLVFSGGTQPPRRASGPDEAIGLVTRDPGSIAYIDRSRVDQRVRIVYEFRD